ncbi:MAG: DUF4405 domain-containing protein [Chitinispirillaceae bacterium]|nr:DUF4405 domain-containing protein [Chitinispirillaceae bacterium]
MKLRFRPFISFLLAFVFTAAAFSGVVLYLRPEGSIADWVAWSFLGLGKKQWEIVHTALVLVLTITVAIHLALNWSILIYYTRRKIGAIKRSVSELSVALACVVFIVVVALLQLPPISWLVHLRGSIKKGTYSLAVAPPLPNADRLTIAELAAMRQTSPENLLARLSQADIVADSSETLSAIAARNRKSPQALYLLLSKDR